MYKEYIPYQENQCDLEAFVAYPSKEKKPLVLLCHAWRGRDDFIVAKAEEVAKWGFVGFALDMYGKGVLGRSKEENAALKKPFIEDRQRLQHRVLKAFEVACSLSYVDTSTIAILGYGFGALCALDLARSGVELTGAISIYGHFDPPPSFLIKPIKAKILILHGSQDPIVPLEEVLRFTNEMDRANIDWQAHIYGGVRHAFANPAVHDPTSGLLYNEKAAAHSWAAVHNFLKELIHDN